MTLFCDLNDAIHVTQNCALSIGNFDGVHRGHAFLLSELKRLARITEGPAVVFTFNPHPATILRPSFAPKPLTTIERREKLLIAQGIDHVIACAPTQDLLNLSPNQFFRDVVRGTLHAKSMVEGPNFFFGKDRTGDVELLEELCDADGIKLSIVEATKNQGAVVSSTSIRQMITDGKIEEANGLLTEPYQICGLVVPGAQRGRDLGFPTANLADIPVLIPGPGVYGGSCSLGSSRHLAAIHIGPNPTFDEGQCKVEVHLLDFSGDIYDQKITVDVETRVRDVMRFSSIEDLQQQLDQDILKVRQKADSTHTE